MHGEGPSWRRLKKKFRRGFRGYPAGTIAFYGPTNEYASKVAVGIVARRDSEPDVLKRWLATDRDVRLDPVIAGEILEFLQSHGVLTVVMTRGLIGCPHEEGVDFPEGAICPHCPFWADRNRWKDV